MGKETIKNRPTLKDMPVELRPRERLIQYGAEALATVELMAIILRTGSTNRTAVEVAQELILRFEDIRGLIQASLEEISQCPGMGQVKAIQLKAALELGRRSLSAGSAELPSIKKPQDIYELLKASFQNLDREHFKVVHLNTKNQVIKVETTAIGVLGSSPVHPREVFKEAIRMSSAALVLTHNHPSGDPSPSQDDILLTTRLREAGEILGISIVDHIIFGDNKYISLREYGKFN
ncbi:MAG TPA: DNA repair protein RadC [Bacillota bacterium]|nr:DNA repair protein RadC [Bacillota bacterium]